MSIDLSALTALSPLDGRYRSLLVETAAIFSEYALIKKRVEIEVRYLLLLSEHQLIPAYTSEQTQQLQRIVSDFLIHDAARVKDIESTTKHDVKAVEYFLREKMTELELSGSHFIHLALTSEDVNNLALSLMCLEARNSLLVPKVKEILRQLAEMSVVYQDTPMLARTHGQPAVPTTVGKEILVFAYRLLQELKQLEATPIAGKLTGAVGTLSAHQAVFDQADWWKLSQEFVTSFGLQPMMYTTQILPAETYSKFFSSLISINSILIDFSQDMWRYISDGYFTQTVTPGQVGSSTMPQKVNPIDFENAEGNLGLSNSLAIFYLQKLPISRLQRDLSDSTVKRSIGVAVGHAVLAYQSLQKGLSKVVLNEALLKTELENHWEVLAEPFQVILRAEGDTSGYEKLKFFAQGKSVTAADVKNFIEGLSISDSAKQKMSALTPLSYTGLAQQIVHAGVADITAYLQGES